MSNKRPNFNNKSLKKDVPIFMEPGQKRWDEGSDLSEEENKKQEEDKALQDL